MARYSPSRRIQTTVPTIYEGLNELIDRGGEEARELEQRQRQEREDEFLAEERGLSRAMDELTAYDQGIRRGEVEERELEPGDDIFEGEGIGMQPGRDPEQQAPPLFQGQRPGMAAGTTGTASPRGRRPAPNEALAQGIDGLIERGPPQEPELVAPAGAFVPGMGFTPRNIMDTDLAAGLGRMAPGMAGEETQRTAPDPNQVQLTPDRFVDLEARRGAPERPEREPTGDAQFLAERLRALGATDEEVDLVMTDPDFADEVISRIEGRAGQFTEEELRAAGVPEETIPAALRDDTVARQAIADARRGPGGSGGGSAAGAERRANARRDEYISGLISEGERDPQALLRQARDQFPDTPTSLADIEDQLQAGDPQMEARRDAILNIAHPVAFGGGRVLDQIVDQLARGSTVEQVREQLDAAAEEQGVSGGREHQRALRYLNELTAQGRGGMSVEETLEGYGLPGGGGR